MLRSSSISRTLGALGIGLLVTVTSCGGSRDENATPGDDQTSSASDPDDSAVENSVGRDSTSETSDREETSDPDETPEPETTAEPDETSEPDETPVDEPPTSAPSTGAPPPSEAQLETTSVALQKFIELPLLTAVVQHPDRSLWFTSQTGEIWRMPEGGQPELVLDLTGETAPWTEGSERGMLGIGFNPVDGRLFLYYNDPSSDSHVVSYALDEDGTPDPASRWEVLFVDQPGIGHKGGGIVFDDNGVMMLALGDGGGSRGRDAQDYSKLLGGIVRIVPRTSGPGYDIPADNPFVNQFGVAPELFAKGLRNPWGFCRDAATGDIWVTDVGEDTIEEINHIPAGTSGMNFGWWPLEGTRVRSAQDVPQPNQMPVWEYRHDEYGPAAIGGCVYRGSDIPALYGAYLISDMSGPTFALGEGFAAVRINLPEQGSIVTAVKMDLDGEPIVLTLMNGGYRLVPV
ncbi:PQQ-dependent sugar dehydrogenase [soil metagenome]